MAQVSVGDVDNLQEACENLLAGVSAAIDTFQSDMSEINTLARQTEENLADAKSMLDEACQEVEENEQSVETCRKELASAQAELQRAETELSQAESDLSAAQSDGEYDEDGNWCPADTSSEESAVVSAEADVAECSSEVGECETALAAAEEQLVKARDNQKKCEELLATSEAAHERLQIRMEEFQILQQRHISEIERQTSEMKARLSQAKQSLDQYLSANPEAAKFTEWVHWQPATNQIVTPQQIHDRLDLSAEQQRQFANYLYLRDPEFRAKIDSYRERYVAASGNAERHAVLIQASRNGSGDFAERLVKQAFSPIGKVSTQGQTHFEDGRFTKTDLFVSDLKCPVILGKGEGMYAPVGGALAVEVKSGHAGYIYAQKDHMVFQAGGHQQASASMSICSKDVNDLSEEKERELREALREAGSPLVGMLPYKDELDSAVWEMVQGREEDVA